MTPDVTTAPLGRVRPPDIAVTVIGGYLGAGKTTLLNHVLRTATERIVVLVNDFGSINIDDDLIASTADGKITLQNGCICCTLADGLAVALDEVRAFDPRPDRLVIEASGVSDPASIASFATGGGLRLDAAVTVVDAETVRTKSRDRYVGDVVLQQIKAADVLVLNKVDLVDSGRASAVRDFLASLAPRAPIVEAVHGEVPLSLLLGTGVEPLSGARVVMEGSGLVATHAGDVFQTWSASVDQPFDRAALDRAVREVADEVVRVKGVVQSTDGRRLVVHRVGARTEVSDDGGWGGGPSRLVAIAVRSEAELANPLDGLIAASTR